MNNLDIARRLSIEQVEFYKDSTYRWKSANIIACLLDKDRFDEYYNKSISWKGKLNKALKDYGLKMYRDRFKTDKERLFFDILYNYLVEVHTKKFIIGNPKYYEHLISREDTDIMLRQIIERLE